MTSIVTNAGALSALATLRTISGSMRQVQSEVATGARVSTAADNAAYWSISTTMSSDKKAISAVADALNLADAMVNVAYEGLNAAVDVLGEFKAKLIAGKEPGVDTAKVQKELDQLQDQMMSVATSASFNGQNWLNTSINDIFNPAQNTTSMVASFSRGANGVSLGTMEHRLAETSLFNSTGGGLLQADPRDPKTLGGIRYEYVDGDRHLVRSTSNDTWSGRAYFIFDFTGPLQFGAGDSVTFDVTVDKDNPADGLPNPQDPGLTTSITIDRSTIDTVLGAGANGRVSTYVDYERVLDHVLSAAGSGAYAMTYTDWQNKPIIDKIGISTSESSGLNGSYVGISNFISTVGSGGLSDREQFSSRGQDHTLHFEPFRVFDGVEVSFDFAINWATRRSYSFDRDYINTTLGKTDGGVDTAVEMQTLLQSMLSADWPDLIIGVPSSNAITLGTDVNADRLAGAKTSIGFTGISVNIEPIPTLNFMDIDIAARPDLIETYINYVDVVSERVIEGAATLGALQSRISLQENFAESLMDSIDTGIGKLVDADMNEASTRLKALQTQEQLATQALSIANSANQNILQLLQ